MKSPNSFDSFLLTAALATVIRALWVVIEVPYLRRHSVKRARDLDKHSAKVWDLAHVLETVGVVLGFASIGRIHTAANLIGPLGLVLLLVGIFIRWSAILTLGKYFDGIVNIRNNHRLVRSGLYKHLRHPAYTGALIAHLGLGLSFVNWFSLALSTVPYLVAAMYRMHVEEQALKGAFGDEYTVYASETKRLIPKVY